jgi:hypothetical protein
MDFDDMPGAVCEASRMLEPQGRLCACITHPKRDAGRLEGGRFVIRGSCFGKRRFELTVSRSGHKITFRGWTYPLQDYVRGFEEAGFVLEALREPPDPARPVPNFVLIRARKR